MQRFMVGLAAALAVAVLPSFAAAQDGKRPDHRPQPEVRSERPNHEGPNARAVFNRLDSNKDGKLSFEEFAVGFRQVSQMMQSRMQGGMKFAHDKMGAFKAEFAKHHGKGHPGMPEFAKKGGPQGKPEFGKFMGFPGPQCPCADKCPGAGCQCGCQMKSPGNMPFGFGPGAFEGGDWSWSHYGPAGRDYARGHYGPAGWEVTTGHQGPFVPGMFKGPMCPMGKDVAKGPMCPMGKDMAKGPMCPMGKDVAKGPMCPMGKDMAKGPKCPMGKDMAKGHHEHGEKAAMPKAPKPPEFKKPECKKPEFKKPADKVHADSQSIEARLTALERQQSEILALLRAVNSSDKSKAKVLARGGDDSRHEPRHGHGDRD